MAQLPAQMGAGRSRPGTVAGHGERQEHMQLPEVDAQGSYSRQSICRPSKEDMRGKQEKRGQKETEGVVRWVGDMWVLAMSSSTSATTGAKPPLKPPWGVI